MYVITYTPHSLVAPGGLRGVFHETGRRDELGLWTNNWWTGNAFCLVTPAVNGCRLLYPSSVFFS